MQLPTTYKYYWADNQATTLAATTPPPTKLIHHRVEAVPPGQIAAWTAQGQTGSDQQSQSRNGLKCSGAVVHAPAGSVHARVANMIRQDQEEPIEPIRA